MGLNESLSSYFARARGFWNELVSIGHTTPESDVVWSVLKGLPTRFDVIVTVLRTTVKNLTLDIALGQLLAVEMTSLESLTLTPDGQAPVQAFVASSDKETRVCHYCKKPGHLIKDCLKRQRAESRKASAGSGATSSLMARADPGFAFVSAM